MSDIQKEDGVEMEDWPKGLYMIFALENDAIMGKVIGLTRTTALIHPWDIQFGGVDEDVATQVVLAEYKEFVAFDDIWDMEEYFESRHWNLMTGKDVQMGEIK